MAQEAVKDKCDLCQTEDNVDFFCIQCDEILCSNCKVGHAKSKSSRNHKIVHLSKARDENIVHKSLSVYCSEHTAVDVSLFCLNCEQLICTQCLAGKHSRHQVTIPDEIKDFKSEELNKYIIVLKEKKAVCENAFRSEGQAHSQFSKSIEQARKDISDQRAKIIQELDIVCYEQNAQLTKLQQNENKRYSDACNEIQVQNQAITSAIQTAENSIASKNTTSIVQATIETANTLHGLEDPTMPPTTIATYLPGDRSHPSITHIQGKVNIEQTTATYQPSDRSHQTIKHIQRKVNFEKPTATHHPSTTTPQVQDKVHQEREAIPEQKSDANNKENADGMQTMIDINNVQVKSTVQVWGKGEINVIVPLQNNKAWIQCGYDTCLTQIDSTGRTITRSASIGIYMVDAKLYKNGLLVTCQQQIYELSADGKLISTFADLSPYNTRGLCVTRDIEVLVCLHRSSTDSKVVRLNTSGHIIQTLQHSTTGTPLYKQPWRLTSLTTGEVIVRDGNKIVGVDREGKHLFTWDWEIQGRKFDCHSVHSITHDSNNNLFVTDYGHSSVLVLGKDDSGAICLLDSTHGIQNPCGIAVDYTGQLWIGCYGGYIHIIEY